MFIRVTPTYYDHASKTTKVRDRKQLLNISTIYEITPTENGQTHLVLDGRSLVANERYSEVSGWLEEKGLVLG